MSTRTKVQCPIGKCSIDRSRSSKNTSTNSRPTSAFCSTRVDSGKATLTRALAAPHADDLKFTWENLADGAAECFANASDCDHAWHRYAEIRHAFASDDMPNFRTREKFRDAARSCQLSPQGAMSPRETVFFAESQLESSSRFPADAKICNAAYAMAKNAAPNDVGDHSINSEWHYGTRDIPRYLGRCLQRATDCATAYAQYKDAYAHFHDHPGDRGAEDPRLLRQRRVGVQVTLRAFPSKSRAFSARSWSADEDPLRSSDAAARSLPA